MKGLNIYQQLQFAIITAMFLGWVVTGAICIIYPDPTDFIVNLYGKLEAVFFTLASMKTLEVAIAKSNGGSNETNSDPTVPTP
jgi:hypothetical protein